MIFLEFLITLIIYFTIVPTVYYFTEVKGMPKWLQWKPFICRKCCTFWTLFGTYIAIGLSFDLCYLLSTGIIISILTAIAMHIDEKEKTIRI